MVGRATNDGRDRSIDVHQVAGHYPVKERLPLPEHVDARAETRHVDTRHYQRLETVGEGLHLPALGGELDATLRPRAKLIRLTPPRHRPGYDRAITSVEQSSSAEGTSRWASHTAGLRRLMS